jgi:hypothetical protein
MSFVCNYRCLLKKSSFDEFSIVLPPPGFPSNCGTELPLGWNLASVNHAVRIPHLSMEWELIYLFMSSSEAIQRIPNCIQRSRGECKYSSIRSARPENSLVKRNSNNKRIFGAECSEDYTISLENRCKLLITGSHGERLSARNVRPWREPWAFNAARQLR